MTNSTITRRQFLSALGLAEITGAICEIATVATAVKPEPARQIPAKFPGKPEYWFGDVIRYPWFSADENKIHWETGEVTGVIWYPEERQWLYTINWTNSTCDTTGFAYPSFDEHLTDDRGFKLVTKG